MVKQDEQIFDFIQDAALDGLWYWDVENPAAKWMSPRFWAVLGYNPDSMPHKLTTWQDVIHPEDFKVASENFTRHCEDADHPYDQTVRFTHRNGSTVWIHCRSMAIRDKKGKAIRMLGAHHDVTELKQQEAASRENEARFDQLAELSGSVAWEINEAGHLTYLSPGTSVCWNSSGSRRIALTADLRIGDKLCIRTTLRKANKRSKTSWPMVVPSIEKF